MASMVISSEKLSHNDEFEGIEVSEINSEFLMSLMEELQDHHDEEKLNSMIQSLEAEINSSFVDFDQDSYMDSELQSISSDGEESDLSCGLVQMDSGDFSASFDDLDMSAWMEMEAMPCSPSYVLNWNEMSSYALDQEHGYNFLGQDSYHLAQ